MLKTFPNSFVGIYYRYFCFNNKIGFDAVNWMLKNLPIRDRDDAVNLGNKLLQSHYIKCISGDPKKGFRYVDLIEIYL